MSEEEAERFRQAKAQANLKARSSIGQPVGATPEELATQRKEEEQRFAEARDDFDRESRAQFFEDMRLDTEG